MMIKNNNRIVDFDDCIVFDIQAYAYYRFLLNKLIFYV